MGDKKNPLNQNLLEGESPFDKMGTEIRHRSMRKAMRYSSDKPVSLAANQDKGIITNPTGKVGRAARKIGSPKYTKDVRPR